MQRHIYWQPFHEIGMEHLRVEQTNGSYLADGLVMGEIEGQPFRLHYRVQFDDQWRVCRVEVQLLGKDGRFVRYSADGKGHWTDDQGNTVHAIHGCIDVDISVTPMTNTLPIRRLGLKPGDSAVIDVCYIAVPQLELRRDSQRYTYLEETESGGKYRFEALDTNFAAEITVDADGFVLDYGDIWARVGTL